MSNIAYGRLKYITSKRLRGRLTEESSIVWLGLSDIIAPERLKATGAKFSSRPFEMNG